MSKARARAAQEPHPQFEQETIRLVSALRDAMASLVEVLPGPVTTAAELQRASGLDMKLCWKVFRVINAPDAMAGAAYVLGPANTRDFLRVMARHGATEAQVRATRELTEAFERLVAEHAGDRRTFDSMVSAWSGEDGDKQDLRQRKAAYLAQTHIWGVQADVMVFLQVLRPSEKDPSELDTIAVGGEYGLRRLRATSHALYSKTVRNLSDTNFITEQRRTPLDPSGAAGQLSLLPGFCTSPLPEFRAVERGGGKTSLVLVHEAVGAKASLDIVAGFSEVRHGNRYRREDNEFGMLAAEVYKPCRVLIQDLMIEAGTFPGGVQPRAYMVPGRFGLEMTVRDIASQGQLADLEPVRRLGRGADVLQTAEVPRYRELVRYALGKRGWDPDRFEAYRCRVEYPVTLSTVATIYDLPPAPGA